ncbi:PorP/SprF family type IX secretion system membrane protein [Rufibacter quisquiliarum]|uniref:Type IX secretion system PorP/SprF family membrane protein n=1 Tax=Rufibacter quisquiliarum TaxID=1549639 RepID=A0A839GLL6_9BACT|nr:PorP/SprF family type IX secretion system membrane protein [Rufibacter quisquiliarum]MBA9075827.1 type IX secretion system PorP/SprF family membrane protein [Rufibacter quisquiliarum]
MKKFLIIIGLAVTGLTVQAQSRKFIGNFSHFSQTYNPALTGQQGSMIKSFYRDRWNGFDNAPRTFFISGEVNMADIRNHTLLSSSEPEDAAAPAEATGVQHGFGVSVLHDRFGPLRENQFTLNYTSGIRISQNVNLQGGIGFSYGNSRMASEGVILNDQGDASFDKFLYGNERIHRYGVNLGVALTAANYYVGYAVQDLVTGSFSDNDFLKDRFPMQHVAQFGVRHSFTDQLGAVLNGMYRYDANEEGLYEAQLKGVYNNFFWLGAGYRQDLAYTFSGGIRFGQLNIGYLREEATGKAETVFNTANEIVVSYNLAPVLTGAGKALSIW